MNEDDVREIADGRVVTGEEAVDLKLVDQLGGLQLALRVAGERAGLSGDPTAVYPRVDRPSLLDVLAESKQSSGFVEKILVGHGSPFLYRW
jgi:protease-4